MLARRRHDQNGFLGTNTHKTFHSYPSVENRLERAGSHLSDGDPSRPPPTGQQSLRAGFPVRGGQRRPLNWKFESLARSGAGGGRCSGKEGTFQTEQQKGRCRSVYRDWRAGGLVWLVQVYKVCEGKWQELKL